MKKTFLISLTIAFVVINESSISWLLAVWVGDYGIGEGFKVAFRYFTILGFLFSAGFRSIPYIVLYHFVKETKLFTHRPGQLALWFALFGITAFHAFGYWSAQHALYTDVRASSTTALAFIFIPIYANIVGLVAGAAGYVLGLVLQAILRRG